MLHQDISRFLPTCCFIVLQVHRIVVVSRATFGCFGLVSSFPSFTEITRHSTSDSTISAGRGRSKGAIVLPSPTRHINTGARFPRCWSHFVVACGPNIRGRLPLTRLGLCLRSYVLNVCCSIHVATLGLDPFCHSTSNQQETPALCTEGNLPWLVWWIFAGQKATINTVASSQTQPTENKRCISGAYKAA